MDNNKFKATIFWLLAGLAPLPLVILHIANLWKQEQYHYLPALLIVSALLFISRWNRVIQLPQRPVAYALGCFAILLLLPYATWLFSPWTATLAWILVWGAFLLSQDCKVNPAEEDSSTGLSRNSIANIWPLSWMLLPLPMNLDQTMTAQLQLRASQLSSYVLDWLQIPHLLLGNVIELTSGRMFVEEACSGVQSLFTLVFCSLLIVVVFHRSLWLMPLYCCAAIFWAALMNICRIVAIAAAQVWYNLDLSSGWKHNLLGYVCLGIAVIMLLSTDRLLRVLFFPTKPPLDRKAKSNPVVYWWNKCFGSNLIQTDESPRSPIAFPGLWLQSSLLVVALVSMLWQGGVFAASWRATPTATAEPGKPFMVVPDELTSQQVPAFTQVSHTVLHERPNMPMGENADVWKGTINGFPVAIALSQPYPTWHDLTICYKGAGWVLNDRLPNFSSMESEWDYTAARWITPTGGYAYTWFSAFNDAGEKVQSIDGSFNNILSGRLTNGQGEATRQGKIAMVQLIVESENMLPNDIVESLRQAHLASREYLRGMTSSIRDNR